MGYFVFLLMHSSALVFIELHSVSDYFFTKLLFLPIFMILHDLTLASISSLGKIKDFEWINSLRYCLPSKHQIFRIGTESIFNSLMSLSILKICSPRFIIQTLDEKTTPDPKSTLLRYHLHILLS